jgi:hypothetical protein
MFVSSVISCTLHSLDVDFFSQTDPCQFLCLPRCGTFLTAPALYIRTQQCFCTLHKGLELHVKDPKSNSILHVILGYVRRCSVDISGSSNYPIFFFYPINSVRFSNLTFKECPKTSSKSSNLFKHKGARSCVQRLSFLEHVLFPFL